MITTPSDETTAYIEKYEEPSHHIETLKNASIITLDIRPRLLFPLWDAGIRTVEQLAKQSRIGFKCVKNFGAGATAEITRILTFADLNSIDTAKI